MLRLLGLVSSCLLILVLFGCAKSGTTAEEKKVALDKAMQIARDYEGVGDAIIDMTASHGKMEIVIKDGIHPQKQADFLQKVAIEWYNAYPEDKKPTVNDMVQVWLYVTDKSQDEVGFMKCYANSTGQLQPDFHHYKTQQSM